MWYDILYVSFVQFKKKILGECLLCVSHIHVLQHNKGLESYLESFLSALMKKIDIFCTLQLDIYPITHQKMI